MRNIISDRQENALLLTLDTNTRSVIRNYLINVSTNSQVLSIVNIADSSTWSDTFTILNYNFLNTSLLTINDSEDNLISRTSPCTNITLKCILTYICSQLLLVIIASHRDYDFLNGRTSNSHRIVTIHTESCTRSIVFRSIAITTACHSCGKATTKVNSSNILSILIALCTGYPINRRVSN